MNSLLGLALLCAILSLISLSSCKKDTIIKTGMSYHIKGNIFNKGAYQPIQPIEVDSLYIDPISGLPFALCRAKIDWQHMALKSGNGVAQATVDGNNLMLENLGKSGIAFGDDIIMNWQFPQEDLK